MAVAVLWFRRDLRLDDSPALVAAAAAGADGVVPLFVVDPKVLRPAGPNRRRFLARTLRELDRQLDGRLVLRWGDPSRAVPALAAETGASVVTSTADFGPYGRRRDQAVGNALAADGRVFSPVSSPYLVPPGMVRAQSGAPFRVFGPYLRAWEALGWDQPSPAPEVRFLSAPSSTSIEDIEEGLAVPGTAGLPPWWEGLPLGAAAELPPAGPAAALARLDRFAEGALRTYAQGRDNPGADGTSRLSPYLHFGCVHPRTVLERSGMGPAPNACAPNWRGGTSTPMCSGTSPVLCTSPSRTSAGTCAGTTTGGRGKGSGPGRRAGPGTRWWTRACGSCWRKAGCTIACGWWWPAS